MTVILGFVAIFVSYIIYWSIQLFFDLLLLPYFGFVCQKISFFGLTFVKENGEWKRVKGKFSVFCQHSRAVDPTKPLRQDDDKMLMLLDLILIGIQVAFTVLLYIIHGQIPRSDDVYMGIRWDYVVWQFVYTNILFCIVSAGTFVYLHIIARKSLLGYCWYLQKRMRSGQPLDDTMMLPLDQLPYKHYGSTEKYSYYRLYIIYLLWVGRYYDLRQPICETTSYLSGRPLFMGELGSYYDLIYYYSRIEYDPALAKKFMDKIRNELANDPDANAKRVIAYYAYYIEGDKQKARVFTNQAKEVVDVFSVPGIERELERRLVNELDGILKKEGF